MKRPTCEACGESLLFAEAYDAAFCPSATDVPSPPASIQVVQSVVADPSVRASPMPPRCRTPGSRDDASVQTGSPRGRGRRGLPSCASRGPHKQCDADERSALIGEGKRAAPEWAGRFGTDVNTEWIVPVARRAKDRSDLAMTNLLDVFGVDIRLGVDEVALVACPTSGGSCSTVVTVRGG